VSAHILRKHIPPNACVLRRLWHSPPSFAKATGMQAGIQCSAGYGVAFYCQLAITKGPAPFQSSAPTLPGCSMLLWKHGMEDHWAIAHPDHQP
jgi:hypothetical protein